MINIHPTAKVHETVVLGPDVTIQENAVIGPYCIIGLTPEHKGMLHINKGVIIGRGTSLTGLITVDGGTEAVTHIGDNCFIMKHSHIGHDASVESNCIISCGAKIGGHAVVGNGTNVGLNAVIHQWKEVPSGCMIGMGAVITKKLEMYPGQKYAGNPAKWIGENSKPNK